MSGVTRMSTTLWLRPTSAIQPYHGTACANWLVSQGTFSNYHQARMWLLALEENDAFQYKTIMSKYFDAIEYHADYKSKRDVNKYHTGYSEGYGEEQHMWY
jgi:hypothetical protein